MVDDFRNSSDKRLVDKSFGVICERPRPAVPVNLDDHHGIVHFGVVAA